ncbi:hypothetical protein KKG41_04315 [Patescibacteria group bacterium]|nr:hypothetical protein [Patescibacteria group bacterium]
MKEKEIARQQLENSGWLEEYSSEILRTITHMNHKYLRVLPGKHLHGIVPKNDYHGYGNESERTKAALNDFQHILINERSESMVYYMLSYFASLYINNTYYQWAKQAKSATERQKNLNDAFEKFDRLANCINHIFEQFSVNLTLTRNGFVPRQDDKITEQIYLPTLKILSDPKWKNVSGDLEDMFLAFRDKNYPETITAAHRSMQRFLQILVGKEGKNAKGEVGKLFSKAKADGLIPVNRFTEPIISVIQGYIVSERATKSTAKPMTTDVESTDALLMMNVVMVFLQHCLQNST